MNDNQPTADLVLLRDMFAMSAMSGLITARGMGFYAPAIAKLAYETADAMLSARQTTKTGE